MPTTATSATGNDDYNETASDAFTRLSIPTCPSDDGTRPIDPSWAGCEVGYQSPAFEFLPVYPLPAGQETTIRVLVRNHGTMDATGVFFECSYNLYIGNQNQGLVPIANRTITSIPSAGQTTVEVPWTPPDTQAVHACVHARVLDAYSLVTYPLRIGTWNSFINPQAGNRNVRLVPIQQAEESIVMPFLERNFEDEPLSARMLIRKIDSRARLRSLEERYPLPFVLERPPVRIDAARAPTEGRGPFTRPTLVPVITSELWPRPDVAERFRHERFGFARRPILEGTAARTFEPQRISVAEARRAAIASYHEKRLPARATHELYVVIPPDEFPPRGRRATFQVDYQIGAKQPVQHTIYLVH